MTMIFISTYKQQLLKRDIFHFKAYFFFYSSFRYDYHKKNIDISHAYTSVIDFII